MIVQNCEMNWEEGSDLTQEAEIDKEMYNRKQGERCTRIKCRIQSKEKDAEGKHKSE